MASEGVWAMAKLWWTIAKTDALHYEISREFTFTIQSVTKNTIEIGASVL